MNRSLFTSNKTAWETPQDLFDALNLEFNFTLDVCADKKNAKCPTYYSREVDGLDQDWEGVVWMNPPYGSEISLWVRKAYRSSRNCICVCLLPVRSDTRWWHWYVMRAAEIRFISKRITFVGGKSTAPFPCAIVVFDRSKNNLKVCSFSWRE